MDEEDPNNWGITFDGSYLWNSEYNYDSLSFLYRIDPFEGTILDTLVIDIQWLFGIEFINGKMYGIDRPNSDLYSIDLITGEVEYISDWCLSLPLGISYVNATGMLYGISGPIDFSGTQSVNGMSDFNFLTNSITKTSNAGIQINPNPASDFIIISSLLPITGELQIFDISGKILKTFTIKEENTQIEVRDFSNGSYFAKFIIGGKIFINQFIILR